MKYKIIFISVFFTLASCALNTVSSKKSTPYNSKGFAYIYNEEDFNNKKLKIKLDNSIIRYLTVKYKKLDTKSEFFKTQK